MIAAAPTRLRSMRVRRGGRRALVLVALVFSVAAAPAVAHDMWIEPAAFAPPVGEALAVHLRIGHGGDAEPFARDDRRILRFAATGPAGEQALGGVDRADPAGVLRPTEAGVFTLSYHSTDAFSELPAARFASYLAEEGLDGIQRLREQRGEAARPGFERYARSLKSLIVVGTPDRPVRDRRVGLPLELVVEAGLGTAGPLELRLFLGEAPLPGARVDVQSLDRPAEADWGRTDDDGRLRFDLGPGRWMIATVHMTPDEPGAAAAAGHPRSEWRSVFATLTLERSR